MAVVGEGVVGVELEHLALDGRVERPIVGHPRAVGRQARVPAKEEE